MCGNGTFQFSTFLRQLINFSLALLAVLAELIFKFVLVLTRINEIGHQLLADQFVLRLSILSVTQLEATRTPHQSV